MCGIAGVYGSMGTGEKTASLNILSTCLAHRGPDGNGRYVDGQVGLQHTRLSIIDLSANGNQPLYNEDRSLVLVCNGEIYNYLDIRKELIDKGHTFSSHSDSEVILHLYEENINAPHKLLDRLTGMFAFALWDTKKKKLFIARDRVGIKPLYYSYENNTLVFSSEVKPIAQTKLVNTEIDYTSLYEYFQLTYIPGPNTLYTHIKCLEAGHYMLIENNIISINEYWDIPVTGSTWKDEAQVIAATENLLKKIVTDHLVADVPVGTFLSGGVDSSLITTLAAENHPGIYSFTASFPGEPEDEGAAAADTARKLGTTHCSFALKNDFFTDFEAQFADLDQPFGIMSALALGRISKLARQKAKVVLSGDGGDELFGGYYRHHFPPEPFVIRHLPAPIKDSILKIGAVVTGKKSLEKLRQNNLIPEEVTFLHKITVTDKTTVLSLFPPSIRAKVDTDRFLHRLHELFTRRKDKDPLNRVLYVDMKTTLVDEMLTKCDRMTMINGIEGRVPFLDHRFIEMAFTIPGKYKRKDAIGKIILRKILAKKLGDELAFSVKTGFNSPLGQWLKTDEATRAYVHQSLANLHHLPFIEPTLIDSFQKNLTETSPRLLFCLVCVNNYFKNL